MKTKEERDDADKLFAVVFLVIALALAWTVPGSGDEASLALAGTVVAWIASAVFLYKWLI